MVMNSLERLTELSIARVGYSSEISLGAAIYSEVMLVDDEFDVSKDGSCMVDW